MKTTFNWTLSNGSQATAEISYEQWVDNGIVDLDGDKIQGKREAHEYGNISIWIGGKQMDIVSFNAGSVKRGFGDFGVFREIAVKGIKLYTIGTSRTNKVAVNKETADKLLAVLVELVKSAEIPEMKEQKAERIKAEIAETESIIEACENQSYLPTEKEEMTRRAAEKSLYNEGGEGYIRKLYTVEQYKAAKEELAKLQNKLSEVE